MIYAVSVGGGNRSDPFAANDPTYGILPRPEWAIGQWQGH